MTRKTKESPPEINGDLELQTNSGPTIELVDLTRLLQLIELAIQRGAYKPNELVTVGTTHSKVLAFLEQHARAQQAKAALDTAGEENND